MIASRTPGVGKLCEFFRGIWELISILFLVSILLATWGIMIMGGAWFHLANVAIAISHASSHGVYLCFMSSWALTFIVHGDVLVGGPEGERAPWLSWIYSDTASMLTWLVLFQLINPMTQGVKCSFADPVECMILLNLAVLAVLQMLPDRLREIQGSLRRRWFR